MDPQPDSDCVRVIFIPISVPGLFDFPPLDYGIGTTKEKKKEKEEETPPEDVKLPYIIQIHVQEGYEAVYYQDKNSRQAYHRLNSSKQEMPPELIQSRIERRLNDFRTQQLAGGRFRAITPRDGAGTRRKLNRSLSAGFHGRGLIRSNSGSPVEDLKLLMAFETASNSNQAELELDRSSSIAIAAGWRGLTSNFEDFGFACAGTRSSTLIGRGWAIHRIQSLLSGGARAVLLSGSRATGKSFLCRHLICNTPAMKRLYGDVGPRPEIVGCHFVMRDRADTKSAAYFVRNMASQLAANSTRYRTAVDSDEKALAALSPARVAEDPASAALLGIILPLEKASAMALEDAEKPSKNSQAASKRVQIFIVDALSEAEIEAVGGPAGGHPSSGPGLHNLKGWQGQVKNPLAEIVLLMIERLHCIPWLRFLITSRHSVRARSMLQLRHQASEIKVDEANEHVKRDMFDFVRHLVSEEQQQVVAEESLRAVSEASAGNFVVAKVTTKAVASGHISEASISELMPRLFKDLFPSLIFQRWGMAEDGNKTVKEGNGDGEDGSRHGKGRYWRYGGGTSERNDKGDKSERHDEDRTKEIASDRTHKTQRPDKKDKMGRVGKDKTGTSNLEEKAGHGTGGKNSAVDAGTTKEASTSNTAKEASNTTKEASTSNTTKETSNTLITSGTSDVSGVVTPSPSPAYVTDMVPILAVLLAARKAHGSGVSARDMCRLLQRPVGSRPHPLLVQNTEMLLGELGPLTKISVEKNAAGVTRSAFLRVGERLEENEKVYRIAHRALAKFLTNKERAGGFSVCAEDGHWAFASVLLRELSALERELRSWEAAPPDLPTTAPVHSSNTRPSHSSHPTPPPIPDPDVAPLPLFTKAASGPDPHPQSGSERLIQEDDEGAPSSTMIYFTAFHLSHSNRASADRCAALLRSTGADLDAVTVCSLPRSLLSFQQEGGLFSSLYSAIPLSSEPSEPSITPEPPASSSLSSSPTSAAAAASAWTAAAASWLGFIDS